MDYLKSLWNNPQVRRAAVSLVGYVLTASAAYVGGLDGQTAAIAAGFLFWLSAQVSNVFPKDA